MLSDMQKKAIREEVIFALSAFEHEKEKPINKSKLDNVLSFLSNGFVLLIIGTLITSILVPIYQNQQKAAVQILNLKRETFSQFLLYTNSIWKEYYLMFPLVHESDVNKEHYNYYLNEISKVKLERYNAYSKIRGVAISFRGKNSTQKSEVEKQIEEYAIELNQLSKRIDQWLKYLYCRSTNCINTDVPKNFTSYGAFLNLADQMQRIYRLGNNVSEALVLKMKN